jgi:hypothetical protein
VLPVTRRARRPVVPAFVVPVVAATLVAVGLFSSAPARADVRACLDAAEEGQKARDAGAYRRARGAFIACAAEECPGEVRKSCVGWLGELEKATPTVVFGARARGAEVSDVRVSVDGEVVATRIDGKPIPLDPGEHRFRFERAGEDPVDQTSVVLAGEKERLMSVRFGPEPVATPSGVASPPGAAPNAPPGSAGTGVAPGAAAVTLGAVGLASLLAGAVLDVSGYVFLQQCAGDPSCTGQHERAEVQWRLLTGDLLLGAGALACVGALLVNAHRHAASGAATAPHVGATPTRSGATVGLTFVF